MAALPRMNCRLAARAQLVVLLPPGQRSRPRLSRAALIGAGLVRALFFSVVGAMPLSSGPVRAAKRVSGSCSDPA